MLCLALASLASAQRPGVAGSLADSPAAHGLARCEYGAWTPLKRLAGIDSSAVARLPSVAGMNGHTYVAGNNLRMMLGGPLPDHLLTAWDLGHGDLGAPSGGRFFGEPIIAGLERGQLLLVWGEPDSLSGTQLEDWMTPRTQVRWATYDMHHGWSPARTLYRGTETVWGNGQSAASRRSRDGAIHLAVPTAYNLKYARFADGAWQSANVPDVPSASYAGIAVDATGRRIRIAFLGAVSGHGPDRNSVFLVRSDDGGTTWKEPQVISRSGHTPALRVSLGYLSPSTLHLLWTQDTTGDLIPELVRHSISRDDGATWSPLPSLVPPVGFRDGRTIIDACGTVHLVYEDWGGGGENGHIDYVRFERGRWTPIEHLFAGVNSMNGVISTPDSRRLLLVGMAFADHGPPEERIPFSIYSELSIRRR
jgi:hypothetical protein